VPNEGASDFDPLGAADQANSDCAATIATLDPADTVVIIGAGLSYPAYPLWSELAKSVCKACGYKGAISAHPKIFQAARDTNPTAYARFLKRRFSAPVMQIRLSLLYLMRLKFRAHLTTNFDGTVVSAAECVCNEPFGVYAYPEHPDPQDLAHHDVIFIHGRCAELFDKSADNLVLHFDAYRRAYIDPPVPLARFFRGVFSTYNCLFVGTSLTDPPLVYLLQSTASDLAESDKTRSLLMASKAYRANTIDEFELLQQLETTEAEEWKVKKSINLLRYAPLTTQHDGLESVFRKVCEARQSLSASRLLRTPGVPETAFDI
jgi:SIR2-like domain